MPVSGGHPSRDDNLRHRAGGTPSWASILQGAPHRSGSSTPTAQWPKPTRPHCQAALPQCRAEPTSKLWTSATAAPAGSPYPREVCPMVARRPGTGPRGRAVVRPPRRLPSRLPGGPRPSDCPRRPRIRSLSYVIERGANGGEGPLLASPNREGGAADEQRGFPADDRWQRRCARLFDQGCST